ncbi:MAG TPA: hypothetical protein VGP46_14375 [Acidimicrobiales bacterium]|jgi:hypothetical protein|nr:hypothetical protein [Acidimicrobiales bacterium]
MDNPPEDIDKPLRIEAESLLKRAFGQPVDLAAIVVRLAPYAQLPRLQVPVRIGSFTPDGGHRDAAVSLRWSAERAKALFPVLKADLAAHHLQSGELELVLDCCYEPPFGLLGAVVDRLAGRALAAAAARTFLDHLVDYFERTPEPSS